MVTQRRPVPDPNRKPTSRHGAAADRTGRAATGRQGAPPPPKKNNLPIILGAAGGGLLVLIVVIVVATSGSPAKPPPAAAVERPKPPAPAWKPPPPDVSHLEAEGKRKCDEGHRIVTPRLRPDPSAPKDRVRADLESGLKLLKEGLEAYRKAASLAGKTYKLDEFEKTQARGISAFCAEIEREGQAALDEGFKIIQSTEARMTGAAKLADEEKQQLKTDLEKGKKLIEEGMNLFDRSYQVSGHTFDTNKYGQALKMSRTKLLELR
jgi:hypothetical protein